MYVDKLPPWAAFLCCVWVEPEVSNDMHGTSHVGCNNT